MTHNSRINCFYLKWVTSVIKPTSFWRSNQKSPLFFFQILTLLFNKHVYFLILHRASIPPKGIVNSYCTCIILEYCSPVFHHAIRTNISSRTLRGFRKGPFIVSALSAPVTTTSIASTSPTQILSQAATYLYHF